MARGKLPIRWIIVILIVIYLSLFVVLNYKEEITIHFVIWKADVSFFFAFLIALVGGAALALIARRIFSSGGSNKPKK